MAIIGKRKSDEDQIACGFSFLALDEEPSEWVGQRRKQVSRKESKEGNVQVYVWGLNDKDQLGGQKGSKVMTTHSLYNYLMVACLDGLIQTRLGMLRELGKA